MKIYIQWTTDPAQDWVLIDSADWSSLPKKPEPVGGEVVDSSLGWVYSINCQGCMFSGDHYAIVDLPDGSTAVASWTDDIDDRPESEFHGTIGIFLDPAYDSHPKVQAVNTQQQFNVYANGLIFNRIQSDPAENRSLDIFDNFVPPGQTKKMSEFKPGELDRLYQKSNLIRHGINVSEQLHSDHQSVKTVRGWREWIK